MNAWLARHPKLVVALAAVAPLVVCLALVPARTSFASVNAGLVLVLVVVAFGATGRRAAGVLAALSSGLWFDFLLTRPYQSLAIARGADVTTAALLLLVGVGVTELAIWGRRQQAEASRADGYLAGLSAASVAVAGGSVAPSDFVSRVCAELKVLLKVERVRFDYGMGVDYPRLGRDGFVRWRGKSWSVESGVPALDKDVEFYSETGGMFAGRFLLAAPGGLRISGAQLQVATSLAVEVAASLSAFKSRGPRDG